MALHARVEERWFAGVLRLAEGGHWSGAQLLQLRSLFRVEQMPRGVKVRLDGAVREYKARQGLGF